jgi:hypothetical protein
VRADVPAPAMHDGGNRGRAVGGGEGLKNSPIRKNA